MLIDEQRISLDQVGKVQIGLFISVQRRQRAVVVSMAGVLAEVLVSRFSGTVSHDFWGTSYVHALAREDIYRIPTLPSI
jgi:hypothetical protein